MRLPGTRCERGFTLVELLIVITIIAVVGLIATTSFRSFRERSILNRAARVVAADAALTRSFAIRERLNVSLVADEAARTYVIRNANGDTLAHRFFNAGSELQVASLDVAADGDSLTFNPRGLLASGGFAQIDVGRNDGARQVQVNAVGRARIVVP
jgi:prepilin-type N-terminal cleavage/methylation domain-containing protein